LSSATTTRTFIAGEIYSTAALAPMRRASR
jgi:hypothetical protein